MKIFARNILISASLLLPLYSAKDACAVSVNVTSRVGGLSTIGGTTAGDGGSISDGSSSIQINSKTPGDARGWKGSTQTSVNLETGELKSYAQIALTQEGIDLGLWFNVRAISYSEVYEIFTFNAMSGGDTPIPFSLQTEFSYEKSGLSYGFMNNLFSMTECFDASCTQRGAVYGIRDNRIIGSVELGHTTESISIDLQISPGDTKTYLLGLGFGVASLSPTRDSPAVSFDGSHTAKLSVSLPEQISMNSGAFFASPIPEPTSALMLPFGLLALWLTRRFWQHGRA